MRIAVFGVGGAGGYFGAQLARAGEDVAFIARGAHLEAIQERGLCVTTAEGEMLVRPAIATDDPQAAGKADVVLLGVKAEQVRSAGDAIRPMLGDNAFVVPLQNGVEAASDLGSVLSERHVAAGLCGTVSWIVAPGHVRSLGDTNFIRFGELDNRKSDRTKRLLEVVARANVRAEIPADIHQAVWEKFLFVASVGGVAALEQQPIGVIRDRAESRHRSSGNG